MCPGPATSSPWPVSRERSGPGRGWSSKNRPWAQQTRGFALSSFVIGSRSSFSRSRALLSVLDRGLRGDQLEISACFSRWCVDRVTDFVRFGGKLRRHLHRLHGVIKTRNQVCHREAQCRLRAPWPRAAGPRRPGRRRPLRRGRRHPADRRQSPAESTPSPPPTRVEHRDHATGRRTQPPTGRCSLATIHPRYSLVRGLPTFYLSGWMVAMAPQTWTAPPSTHSSMPVTKLLSSEARNCATLAISSDVPSRPSGRARRRTT